MARLSDVQVQGPTLGSLGGPLITLSNGPPNHTTMGQWLIYYNTPPPQKSSDPNPLLSALIAQMTPALMEKLKETMDAQTSGTEPGTSDSEPSPSGSEAKKL